MLKIIVSGCNGHMGRVVAQLCAADPQVEVVAGFDVLGPADREFPVCSAPDQFHGEADAVIDFSSPAALDGLLKFARERKVPLVLATTGYTPEQVAQIGHRRPGSAHLPLGQHVPGHQCAAGAGEEGRLHFGRQLRH